MLISSDRMMKKPEAAFMNSLVSKFGLDKSKCVMIGNEIGSDIKIAKDIGMHSILVKDGDFSKII